MQRGSAGRRKGRREKKEEEEKEEECKWEGERTRRRGRRRRSITLDYVGQDNYKDFPRFKGKGHRSYISVGEH